MESRKNGDRGGTAELVCGHHIQVRLGRTVPSLHVQLILSVISLKVDIILILSLFIFRHNNFISAIMASYVGDESVQDSTTTSAAPSATRGTSSVAIDGSSVKGKRGKQRLCPHCLDVVSRATYFRHKRAFYDHQTKEWKSESQVSSAASAAAAAGEVGGDCATPLDGRRGF